MRHVADRLAIPTRRDAEAPRAAPAARHYHVSDGSRVVGSAVRDLPLGNRAWVDRIVRDGHPLKLRGRDVIRAGDDLVVTCDDEGRARCLRRLREEPRSSEPRRRTRSRSLAGDRSSTHQGDEP